LLEGYRVEKDEKEERGPLLESVGACPLREGGEEGVVSSSDQAGLDGAFRIASTAL